MEKKNWLVHGAWVVAAIGTFVLGSQFPTGGDRAGESAASGDRVGSGKTLRGSTPGGESRAGTGYEAGRSAGNKGAPGGEYGSGKLALSDLEIVSLGKQFREVASPIDRRLAFSRLLDGLTPENALLVREQVLHLPQHSAEFREFHYAWGAMGGVEAIMSGADTPKDDMSPALAGWASADPRAALAWFEDLDMENDAAFDSLLIGREISPDDLRNHLMRGLVQGLADADPDAASEFVHAVAATGNRIADGMIHTVLEAVMRTGSPAGAALWSEGLPAGRLRNQAMERVAKHFVGADLEAAVGWAENFSGRPENAGVIAAVGSTWASRDPEEAVAWLNGLPEGRGQNAGMNLALGEWAEQNPTAASEYLSAMPTSDSKDAAISGFSSRLAPEDPQAAITWAESISSEEQRLEAIIGAGRVWVRRDADAAAKWAVSSGLPENVQLTILTPPGRGAKRKASE